MMTNMTIPRILAERLLESDALWDDDGPAAQTLADSLSSALRDYLSPPAEGWTAQQSGLGSDQEPEPAHDPEVVEAVRRAFALGMPGRPPHWNDKDAIPVLDALRDEGWEVVRSEELDETDDIAGQWEAAYDTCLDISLKRSARIAELEDENVRLRDDRDRWRKDAKSLLECVAEDYPDDYGNPEPRWVTETRESFENRSATKLPTNSKPWSGWSRSR